MRRNLARSREAAQKLVNDGRVTVSGTTATKSATQVDPAVAIVVKEDDSDPGYASRGGHKLAGALDHFSDLKVEGRRCLDAGASTGGFTDVLLRRGAEHVVAVDVGYGQLVWALQQDPRVTVRDRTNVRELTPEQVAPAPSLVVGDLSFISLRLVLPALVGCVSPDADLLLMVKPQFEVGRDRLGSGGVVRDPQIRADASVPLRQPRWNSTGECVASWPARFPAPVGMSSTSCGCTRGLHRWRPPTSTPQSRRDRPERRSH